MEQRQTKRRKGLHNTSIVLSKKVKLLRLKDEEEPVPLAITVRAQFHQRSRYSFYKRRSQKGKKDSQVVNLFYTLRIYKRKSCT